MLKNVIIPILITLLLATLALGQAASSGIEGNWIGALEFSGTKLRLAFKVVKVGDSLQAKFDSPDQGATDLDVDTVTFQGQSVKFEAKSLDSPMKKIHAIIKNESDRKRIEQLVNEEVTRFVGTMNETQRKAFRPLEANIKGVIPMYQMPWFRYFITFDPTPVLMKVKVPVLALNGELDVQVSSKENLALIAAALKAGKNKDVTIRSFPNLNHLFQTSKTGSLSEYAQIEETMSPEVLKTISDWVLARTRK